MTFTLGRELVDLVLPTRCAACQRRGPVICRVCLVDVGQARFGGGARPVQPTPVPVGLPPTWAVASLGGALRSLLTSYKDEGRRDLAPALGGLLAESVRASLRERVGCDVVLVPVPASARSRRARGDRPLEGLALAAAARLPGDVRVVRALHSTRQTRDQSGLDHAQRRSNVHASMQVASSAWPDDVRGRAIFLVDDILTTGSTLAEASRALAQSGLRSRAAVVAATQRRPVVSHPFPD